MSLVNEMIAAPVDEGRDFINTTYDISLDSSTSRRCSKRILSAMWAEEENSLYLLVVDCGIEGRGVPGRAQEEVILFLPSSERSFVPFCPSHLQPMDGQKKGTKKRHVDHLFPLHLWDEEEERDLPLPLLTTVLTFRHEILVAVKEISCS